MTLPCGLNMQWGISEQIESSHFASPSMVYLPHMMKRHEEDNELLVHQELSKAFKFIFYQRLCENVRNVVVSANYDKNQVSILDLISKMMPFYADVFCSWFLSCGCCSKHDACSIVFEDVRWL